MGIAILTVISALVLGYLTSAATSQQWTAQQARERRVEAAAEDAINLAVHELWSDFRIAYQDRRTTHWDVKFYLDSIGIEDQSAAATPVRTNLLAMTDLAQDEEGQPSVHDCAIERLELWRIDGTTDVQLFVEVEARAQRSVGDEARRLGSPQQLTQTFVIDGEGWEGLDYAMLANNINCIMCHTTVTDADLHFNTDASLYGTFERVKVGSLESFQLRDDPDSTIAGTLYLAGAGIDGEGNHLTDWASIAMKSRDFGAHGLLEQDTWGALTPTDLSPADPFNITEMANLYLDYSDPSIEQVDGFLPDAFPSPFPDDGGFDFTTGQAVDENAGNRILDDSEFEAIARLADGSLSAGTIAVSPEGTVIGDTTALAALTAGDGTASLGSSTTGNVYLHGTEANPILLNGDVALKGDVILSGVVKGSGTLLVSGNVYVPSDLTYLDGATVDGDRTFSVASDGTRNTLAIASGGNVVVGDVFRPTWGEGDPVTGNPDGDFNFILEELALFNRSEWLKTQETLQGKSYKVEDGTKEVTHWDSEWVEYATPIEKTRDVWENQPYWDDVEVPIYEVVDGYQILVGYETQSKQIDNWVKTGTETYFETGTWESTSWTETVTDYDWVRDDHVNPLYEGEDYLPRYYQFTEGSVVPIYNEEGYFDPASASWIADERPDPWDTTELTLADPNDPSDPTLFDADGNPRAVLSTITAGAGWITDEMLEELMRTSLAARDATQALTIDATLYSNNSIFGVVPARNSTGTNGELVVNGSIVAADVGLLAPGGFQLRYDERGGERLDIRADTQVSLRRQLVTPSRPD